ncbi:MAG: 4Fe-4S binding protein, partial [Coriobacteriales bacterium]|nr:4Fe-4S binding protein [Coriobacteriales bacterium]
MKKSTLRMLIALAILVIISVGFVTFGGIGTLSAIGWKDISLLCPLGALTTMLASKTLVPQVIISLVLVVALILVLGRTFCGWACPVPLVSKLRHVASPASARAKAEAKEREAIRCDACGENKGKIDSRHIILGGSLLSALVFGFPVFCLIWPIGLTFATILLVILLFSGGDITWSLVVVPVLLLVEVIFFRKWCSKICPVSALMSLIAKGNKTLQPQIDADKCLQTSKGVACHKCATACPEGIDLHDLAKGAPMSECTRCFACVEACPTQAITIPFLPKKSCGGCGGAETAVAKAEVAVEAAEATAATA